MINDKRVLAVIPARAGSKGLPGKNIRRMCGKPLIAWSIEQGLATEYIDKLIVSTDSEDVSFVAKEYGAEVPFIRPVNLADDTASSIDVLLHAIDFLENQNEYYEYVIFLEPTSPLRDISDISGALEFLDSESKLESIVGVAKVESAHPSFLYAIQDGFLVPMSGSQPTGLRRQDIKKDFYFLEGSIYISKIASLRKHRSFYHLFSAPWVVERYKALEIDEISDFISAEALMQAKLEGVLK